MNNKQKIILSVVILVLVNLLLVIVFGDNGLVDYQLLKSEKERLVGQVEDLNRENLALYREIDRLKNDLKYIENVARQELGVIGENEVIFKFNEPAKEKAKKRQKNREQP